MRPPQVLPELVMRALGHLVDQKHHNRHHNRQKKRPGDLGEAISEKAWLTTGQLHG